MKRVHKVTNENKITLYGACAIVLPVFSKTGSKFK